MNKEQEILTVSDLAMYIGQEANWTKFGMDYWTNDIITLGILEMFNNYPSIDFKPILRPLSDMTEEESTHYHELLNSLYKSLVADHHIHIAKITQWLISKGFDVFNWIPEGKALDKTNLSNDGTK